MRRASIHPVAACVAATILALVPASPARATWSTTPFASLPLCTAGGDQVAQVLAPDGSGGAFVAWLDERGAYSVYATRVLHDGTLAPGWPADGLGVCTVAGYKSDVRVVPGSSGDVYVLWEDQRAGNWDVYAQRVLGNGAIAPGWPADGLALATDVRHQTEVQAAPDGAGGFYAVWTLEFSAGTDYDIYATRVLPSGAFAPSFAVNGLAINGGSYVQNQPAITADGAGDAIIVYASEDNTATALIWGQKLTAAGGRVWGSPFAGLQVSAYGNDQRSPRIVSDGAGGAIVGDIFANVESCYMLLDAGGARRDVLLETLPVGGGYQFALRTDGAGGAWASWRVNYSPPYQGYLEHIDARLRPTTVTMPQVYSAVSTAPPDVVPMPGASAIATWATDADDVRAQGYDANVVPLWGGASVMVAGAPSTQYGACAVSDGADGAIVVWEDRRSGNVDLYAARVDRFGALGDAAPALTRLADVPNDQGGSVSLQWKASYLDAAPTFPIARYSVWRRAPGGVAALRGAGAARVIEPGAPRAEGAGRVFRAQPTATGVVYWEYLSQVPARGYPGYSAVAPTTSDSIAGSNPRTSFRIEAESATGVPYWDSAPDSAYSVDNLAPAAPAPFTGTYAGGTATLAWQANAEPDVAAYRLYRGATSSFTPSPANLVAEQPGTGFADPAGAPYWYKLAAVDVHGNVGPFATLLPSGTTNAGGPGLPRELALAPPAPNPARGASVLRFALPAESSVTLAIYDAAGRRVRTLARGAWPAGEHAIRWDGTNESGGPAGPGLYFARLEAGGRVLERRLAMIR